MTTPAIFEDLHLRTSQARTHSQIQPDAQAGETQAIDVPSLVANYSGLLFRVANSILRNPADAEDTVQDALLRVLEHKAKLPHIQDLRVWLVRITWNLALDRCRRIRPGQLDPAFAAALISPGHSPESALAERRTIERVLETIDRLSAKERETLLLSALDELSTPEIAAVLQRSESAVRALLFRARTHLRQRLQGDSR